MDLIDFLGFGLTYMAAGFVLVSLFDFNRCFRDGVCFPRCEKRQKMEAATEDKFPEGLRVLAVDDNSVCLKVLEAVLRCCKYHRESLDPSTSPSSAETDLFVWE